MDTSSDISQQSYKEKLNQTKSNVNYLFKVILIGNSFSGKTSLLTQFISNEFKEKYICTIGVDFMIKEINLGQELKVKLQIWDTAGMERYKQMTTSYYKGAQCCVIVFDITNRHSFEGLGHWMSTYEQNMNKEFKKFLVVVGNKEDLEKDRQVSYQEANEFCKINGIRYFETSAKNGKNVDDVFFYVGENIYEMYKSDLDSEANKLMRIRNSLPIRKGSEVDLPKKKQGCKC